MDPSACTLSLFLAESEKGFELDEDEATALFALFGEVVVVVVVLVVVDVGFLLVVSVVVIGGSCSCSTPIPLLSDVEVDSLAEAGGVDEVSVK